MAISIQMWGENKDRHMYIMFSRKYVRWRENRKLTLSQNLLLGGKFDRKKRDKFGSGLGFRRGLSAWAGADSSYWIMNYSHAVWKPLWTLWGFFYSVFSRIPRRRFIRIYLFGHLTYLSISGCIWPWNHWGWGGKRFIVRFPSTTRFLSRTFARWVGKICLWLWDKTRKMS